MTSDCSNKANYWQLQPFAALAAKYVFAPKLCRLAYLSHALLVHHVSSASCVVSCTSPSIVAASPLPVSWFASSPRHFSSSSTQSQSHMHWSYVTCRQHNSSSRVHLHRPCHFRLWKFHDLLKHRIISLVLVITIAHPSYHRYRGLLITWHSSHFRLSRM